LLRNVTLPYIYYVKKNIKNVRFMFFLRVKELNIICKLLD